MRNILLTFFFATLFCSASVREVLKVYQPLSLHGTDTAEPMGGEIVQADVLSSPMVLSGAMPEILVSAIANPHKLASVGEYPFDENNLLVLCKISLTSELKDKELIVTFDVSKMSMPEEVDLSARTVLILGIKAVKLTLGAYYHDSDAHQTYRIVIAGTSDKNATLKDLGEMVKPKK